MIMRGNCNSSNTDRQEMLEDIRDGCSFVRCAQCRNRDRPVVSAFVFVVIFEVFVVETSCSVSHEAEQLTDRIASLGVADEVHFVRLTPHPRRVFRPSLAGEDYGTAAVLSRARLGRFLGIGAEIRAVQNLEVERLDDFVGGWIYRAEPWVRDSADANDEKSGVRLCIPACRELRIELRCPFPVGRKRCDGRNDHRIALVFQHLGNVFDSAPVVDSTKQRRSPSRKAGH